MSLSRKEEEFLLLMKKRDTLVFNSKEAQFYWGSSENAANALSRLTHKNQLVRLARGVYIIDPGGNHRKEISPETKYLLAAHLTPDAVIAYQSAMHLHGLDQSTYDLNHITIQSIHRKHPVHIHQAHYHFITVPKHVSKDIQTLPMGDRNTVRVSNLEKTLIDCALHPDFCTGIINVLHFLKQFALVFDWQRIDQILFLSQAAPAMKRLGYLIEKFDIPIPNASLRLASWKNHLSQGIIHLEYKSRQAGHIHTQWLIEDNAFEIKERAR